MKQTHLHRLFRRTKKNIKEKSGCILLHINTSATSVTSITTQQNMRYLSFRPFSTKTKSTTTTKTTPTDEHKERSRELNHIHTSAVEYRNHIHTQGEETLFTIYRQAQHHPIHNAYTSLYKSIHTYIYIQ